MVKGSRLDPNTNTHATSLTRTPPFSVLPRVPRLSLVIATMIITIITTSFAVAVGKGFQVKYDDSEVLY